MYQRTVQVRIDDVDKNGVAMGRLYLQVQQAAPPGMPTTPGGGPPHKHGRQGPGPGPGKGHPNNNPALAAAAASSSTGPMFALKPYALMLVSEGLARVDRKVCNQTTQIHCYHHNARCLIYWSDPLCATPLCRCPSPLLMLFFFFIFFFFFFFFFFFSLLLRQFKPAIASLANDHGVTEKETLDLLAAQTVAMNAKKVMIPLPLCSPYV